MKPLKTTIEKKPILGLALFFPPLLDFFNFGAAGLIHYGTQGRSQLCKCSESQVIGV